MNSIAGQFLVASPHLKDGNFLRTVVLMINHDEDGAFGLVLTRPKNETLKDIWEMIGSPSCPVNDPLFWGGPVPSPLIALHDRADLSETEVMADVYLSTHKDKLEELVAKCHRPLRIFTGYSGWGAGQLEGELKAGGWLLTPATGPLIFGPYENLWDEAIARVGAEILRDVLPPGGAPSDPSCN